MDADCFGIEIISKTQAISCTPETEEAFERKNALAEGAAAVTTKERLRGVLELASTHAPKGCARHGVSSSALRLIAT